jgi:hypothetical protein
VSELPIDYANYGVVVPGGLLKSQRDNVRRFLQAVTEGIYVFKTKPELAQSVLKQSNSELEMAGPLHEGLAKAMRDYPVPEPRGIQNALDSLLTPKRVELAPEISWIRA